MDNKLRGQNTAAPQQPMPQAHQQQPGPKKYDGKEGPLYDEKVNGHYGMYCEVRMSV
jgi:hypothetical protein